MLYAWNLGTNKEVCADICDILPAKVHPVFIALEVEIVNLTGKGF